MSFEGGRQPDWLGRGVGLAVFAGGIVLLIVVFVWTGQLGTQIAAPGQKADVGWAIRFGIQIAKLFISGLIASWIAGRGAQMYAAASRALSGD